MTTPYDCIVCGEHPAGDVRDAVLSVELEVVR